jgi:hypothetical protein
MYNRQSPYKVHSKRVHVKHEMYFDVVGVAFLAHNRMLLPNIVSKLTFICQ